MNTAAIGALGAEPGDSLRADAADGTVRVVIADRQETVDADDADAPGDGQECDDES